MQTTTVDAPPGPSTHKIQIVPLAGLPVVAVLLGFVVYSIASNQFWALMLCHVAGGALWTSIDLFVGLAIGPIIGGMSPPARAEFSAKFMPKMVIIMPTVVTMTLATGLQIALHLGTLGLQNQTRNWLVASMIVVGVMAVIALGILEPANITVLWEMNKPNPNHEVIARMMKRFVYTAGITGVMQIATLVIMTRVATL
ncbi:MAG: hypothetical protein QOC57_1616 [Ilumatobacteraceae bacterium]|jgi:hypothetical protein|nr:hypothetical protein [Ilumatobacteraceae bacterium]